MLLLTDGAPAAKRCKMEPSPQNGSPSVKSHDAQSTSSQQAFMNSMSNAASGSGTQMNLQTSGAPPPNVVIPPQHSSNPPSVGSTASQSATPIQPHPPTAGIHALSNQLVQPNFSPQTNSNTSTAPQQQVYASSYSSTMQQQASVTAASYAQGLQQSSQPRPHMEPDGSAISGIASNPLNFDSVVSTYIQ